MHLSIFSSLLFELLVVCVWQPTALAKPYEGYVLAFELMPDDDGNVVDCNFVGQSTIRQKNFRTLRTSMAYLRGHAQRLATGKSMSAVMIGAKFRQLMPSALFRS